MEQNMTFAQVCGSQQNMNQQKRNLDVAHVEKRYCCFLAENFVQQFYSNKTL